MILDFLTGEGLSILTATLSAGAVYGGVKGDLRRMHEKIESNAAMLSQRVEGLADEIGYQRGRIDAFHGRENKG